MSMRTAPPGTNHGSLEPMPSLRRATMIHRWDDLSFVHWGYEPSAVRPLVPAGLELDLFDGAAWIGVIPFRCSVRVPGSPYAPWVSRFPEMNVRTYVLGPDGQPGIWFLSLDASRLGAVLVARRSYRLPYMWSRTKLHRNGNTVSYSVRRRWPSAGAGTARLELALEIGGPVDRPSDLERFVTRRWHLYSPRPLALPPTKIACFRTSVDHPEWPLRQARITRIEGDILEIAGLPAPSAQPFALFSPGVRVRFEKRRLV